MPRVLVSARNALRITSPKSTKAMYIRQNMQAVSPSRKKQAAFLCNNLGRANNTQLHAIVKDIQVNKFRSRVRIRQMRRNTDRNQKKLASYMTYNPYRHSYNMPIRKVQQIADNTFARRRQPQIYFGYTPDQVAFAEDSHGRKAIIEQIDGDKIIARPISDEKFEAPHPPYPEDDEEPAYDYLMYHHPTGSMIAKKMPPLPDIPKPSDYGTPSEYGPTSLANIARAQNKRKLYSTGIFDRGENFPTPSYKKSKSQWFPDTSDYTFI